MLNEIDLQELKEIGLNENTIEKIHVKSISVKEAIDKGFYLKIKWTIALLTHFKVEIVSSTLIATLTVRHNIYEL